MRHLQITTRITNRESAAVELYFNDISKLGFITAQEEVALTQKIRLGDQAALNKLVNANLRFVVSVAKKYQYQGLPLSDLINEGNLGLIKAANRFDETKGFKFISFAVWWIRQSMLAAITEHARMIRLPMNKVGEIRQIHHAAIAIEQQTQRDATEEQIAEFLDMPIAKVKDGQESDQWTCSYDVPYDEEGYTMLETLTNHTPGPDAGLLVESQQQEMEDLLARLSDREKKIIQLTYGLTGDREMSPIDISKEMGMSAERVRQIRNIALEKLKNHHSS